MVRIRLLLVILTCLFMVVSTKALSKVTDWILISNDKEVPEQISIQSIKNELLSESRLQAIEKAAGIKVSAFQSHTETEITGIRSTWQDSFHKMINIQSNGRVIEERKNYSQIIKDDRLYVRLDYRAKIDTQDVLTDPDINLMFETDKPIYRIGESVSYKVSSNKGGYIYIFSILQDGMVAKIFPNRFSHNNSIEAGETRVIPDNNEKGQFIFKIQKSETEEPPYSEVFYIVFSKDELMLFSQYDDFSYKYDLCRINRDLLNQPNCVINTNSINYVVTK